MTGRIVRVLSAAVSSRIWPLPAVALLGVLLVAATGAAEAAAPVPATAPAPAPAAARRLTDGAGRSVTLPAAAPTRVVSLSPALTEMVVVLGGGAQLVGVTRFCAVPERAPPVARVGGINDPDYEAILALRPDVVLLPNLADQSLPARLGALGVRTVIFYPEALDALPRDLRLAGAVLGRAAEAERAAEAFARLRALVAARLAADPPAARLAAVLLYPPGLLAPGPRAFAGQLLEAAGARNAVPDGATAWTELSAEGLLKLNPAVIVVAAAPGAPPWPAGAQPGLAALEAVRAGRVLAVPEELLLRPGPAQGAALWALARALHPARFPEAAPPAAAARP